MYILRKTVCILFVLVALTASAAGTMCEIDLSGLWRFQLDPMGFGMTPGSELYLSRLPETIVLPGSTDTGNKGIKNTAAYVDRLSRKHEYLGPAWYQREITVPNDWSGKAVTLEFERCHWITTLYIDGKRIGTKERLSTPDRWDLTGRLTPGVHTLTLCVDNRSPYPMDQWSHGITEYTQTNWNGITGGMRLIVSPESHISSLSLYPDAESQTVKTITSCTIRQPSDLTLNVTGPDGKQVLSHKIAVNPGDSVITANLPLGPNARLWDEFDPALYTVTATLNSGDDTDTYVERFGLRNVTQGRHHIQINGINRHLRGTLDCAVWPLTGYPSTEKADWSKIMSTLKDYGMNHLRFHSWCPPEAAFEAADEAGIYLQVELPMWIKDVGRYPKRRDWFEREMYAILDEYGNHPSFILFCNGNENEGDFSVLEDLINKGKAHDSRHLYSASTARTHTASDQYYVSHISNKGWMTVYEGRPETDWNINEGSDIDVPAIAHETGQRCMYPDFREMAKYTGVLEPRNMGVFRDRLARNGMLHQAEDFFKATGAHTVLQYKAVNEALLNSDKSGGFQLLGLQDFPGQGSAFIGILDAFWDSKGLVTPEKFRESSAPEVILAGLHKRIYSSSEPLQASVHIYNFGPAALRSGALKWHLDNENGVEIASGKLACMEVPRSTVDSIGVFKASLAAVTEPSRLILHIEKGDLRNSWDIWVYPDSDDVVETAYVTDLKEALRRVAKGESVLLVPADAPGRSTHFASHFWNPIMFNWDPMIVGTLIDNAHPAFGSFPTDMYADWQWTDILNNARAMDLTDIPELTPVIQSIDTYEVNRKLGVAFEANVGSGKLFVLCVDPVKDIDKRPASRRLLRSVSDYVAGDSFNPSVTLEPWQVEGIFTPVQTEKGEAASDAVKQLLNQ
ncbi:MAG: beta-galactosidase [Muribaculaceae bacterium]|nr:beta-galactosidase [Muribaculaceae bacterium]